MAPQDYLYLITYAQLENRNYTINKPMRMRINAMKHIALYRLEMNKLTSRLPS